ncbi:MAG: hypothetical protein KatS3mg110_1727 [Pirellulaceae bacterium]|nr:MAG: hypothetical protein KatS3mg110_1727 [Pirellulaceae bacterium]
MADPVVRGVVHVIEPTRVVGQRGFRKRLVVLEQDMGRFTNYIPVEFINDQCDRVDELQVGDEAEISYRLSGRKWQRDPSSEVKYFVSVEAIDFRILKSGSGAAAQAQPPAEEPFDDMPPF